MTMSSELHHDVLPLVERIAGELDAHRRERLLLAAAQSAAEVPATALWRRLGGQSWERVVAVGPLELLPNAGQVAAVAGGELDPLLPGGRRVILSGGRALALGGIAPDGLEEDVVDLIEALLVTACLLDGEQPSLTDLILPPFPTSAPEAEGTRGPGSGAGELRHLLSRIRSTEELLARDDLDLDPDERARFAHALDEGCEWAGDLLISALGAEASSTARPGRLGPVLRSVLATEEAAARLSQVDLELDLDQAALDLPLGLDATNLGRAVIGLLAVALPEYSTHLDGRPAPTIRASLERRNGPGVALRIGPLESATQGRREASHETYAALESRVRESGARLLWSEERNGRNLVLWFPATATEDRRGDAA